MNTTGLSPSGAEEGAAAAAAADVSPNAAVARADIMANISSPPANDGAVATPSVHISVPGKPDIRSSFGKNAPDQPLLMGYVCAHSEEDRAKLRSIPGSTVSVDAAGWSMILPDPRAEIEALNQHLQRLNLHGWFARVPPNPESDPREILVELWPEMVENEQGTFFNGLLACGC